MFEEKDAAGFIHRFENYLKVFLILAVFANMYFWRLETSAHRGQCKTPDGDWSIILHE